MSFAFDSRLVAHWPDDLERTHQVAVHDHNGPCVIELSAVVRGGEDRHQLPIRLELVSVLHDLVRSAYELQAVAGEEILDDIMPKGVRHSSTMREKT